MRKDKKEELATATVAAAASAKEVPVVETPPPAPPVSMVELPATKLSPDDKVALDLAKAKRDLAVAQAEKMVAQSETADVSFKYLVLQIYMKYKLTEKDGIDEAGNIIYGNYK